MEHQCFGDFDSSIWVYPFNAFTEMKVFASEGNNKSAVFLSPSQVNKLITHLAACLDEAGVPVELLNAKPISK